MEDIGKAQTRDWKVGKGQRGTEGEIERGREMTQCEVEEKGLSTEREREERVKWSVELGRGQGGIGGRDV